MDEKDIAETAYRNGYEAGKRDAVEHGYWDEGTIYDLSGNLKGYGITCSVCEGTIRAKTSVEQELLKEDYKYCPFCGARLDGDGDV